MGYSGDDRRRTQRQTRLLDRVVSLRNSAAARRAPAKSASAVELSSLRARLDQLEAALLGLQRAVHQDAQRHARELAELRDAIGRE